MLQEEWFIVFDWMAVLYFKVLPQSLNKDNMVNPLFTAAEENTATWPDPDSMEKHQAMPKAKLEELVTKRDEASQIKNPGKQLLLNDSNMVHVTERPTTKKAAIDLVSPDKESVVILHSSTDCPIDQLTPEKRPMAGTLKSTTQKSIEAPLTDVLLNESEEAPQSSLQKVLNGEPIDDIMFDHDLEDMPSKDN